MATAIFAVVVVAALAYAYFSLKNLAPEQEHMKPEGMDAFRVTYNQEGMPIPLTWGIVRVPGNLLWYGNLRTEEITERVDTGKDHEHITVGYKYYIDHWQAVCMGPAFILKIFVDNKPWEDDGVVSPGVYNWYGTYYTGQNLYSPTIWYNVEANAKQFDWSCGNILANDAVVTEMQDQIGEYANRLQGVAFAWFNNFLAGENRTFLPTIHYIVEKYSEVPLTYANMSKGCNPAAIIWEILVRAGVDPNEFDFASFQAAANYWYSKGYGLNMAMNSQTTAREAIQKVFNYVDGGLYINEDDEFVLKAYTESDTSVVTINTEEFKSFTFERPSWDDVYSDFRGEYTDEDREYSKRALRVINSAVRGLTGYLRQMTVNLSAFRDVTTASKRLWEIARKQSYPASTVQFSVGLKHLHRNIGDVITINNTDYGIVDAEFRIVSKDMKEIDENEVGFTAVQFLEGMILDTYVPAGDPHWERPDYYTKAAQYAEFFELPYNPLYGRQLAWLALVQRQSVETGYLIRYSINDSDYYTLGSYDQWSVRCNLEVAYPATTDDIDDDAGLILEPDYREEAELFLNQSRSDLFIIYQVAIAGNEIMAFQYYQPYGSTGLRLTGVIRGLWNTPVESHNVDDKVWLTRIRTNVITDLNAEAVSLKVLPYFGGDVMTDDVVPTHPISITNKSLNPWPVGNIRAVRSGTSITVTWWPTPQDHIGAGATAAENQDDQDPMEWDGDFVISDTYAEVTPTNISATEKQWTQGSLLQTTFYVQARRDGNLSSQESIVIPTVDGTYWA